MTDTGFLYEYLHHLRVTAKPSSCMRAHYAVNNLVSRVAEGATLDHFVTLRRYDGAADTTINAELRIWRAALNYKSAGLGASIKLLREERKLPTILGPGLSIALFSAVGGNLRVRLSMILALFAGLRHGEIQHLRWMDVRHSEIHVVPQADWSPKNHAERVIPMHTRVRVDLDWFQPNEAPKAEEKIIGTADLYAPIAAAFRKAGLVRPDGEGREGLHMLRRTFASNMLANGADINTVRELMGHADLATTQRYLVSSLPQKRAAVAGL